MKKLYSLLILIGSSCSLMAMESTIEKHEKEELKEIVIEKKPISVEEFVAQLKVPNKSFDRIKDCLQKIAHTSPKTYRNLTQVLKEEVPWEILRYKDSYIKLLGEETLFWRQLAWGGWVATTLTALTLAIGALTIANH